MYFSKNLLKIILALFSMVLIGCQSSPDFEARRSEILDLHKKLIDDHLKKNVDSLVQDFSEDYVFVSNGEISHPTKEELQSSFRIYLNSTAFTDYRDLSEPIIGISEDGSVAWSIVKVKVAGSQIRDDGSKRDFDVTYAWITLFKQQGGKWKRLIEVSTDNQESDG